MTLLPIQLEITFIIVLYHLITLRIPWSSPSTTHIIRNTGWQAERRTVQRTARESIAQSKYNTHTNALHLLQINLHLLRSSSRAQKNHTAKPSKAPKRTRSLKWQLSVISNSLSSIVVVLVDPSLCSRIDNWILFFCISKELKPRQNFTLYFLFFGFWVTENGYWYLGIP